MRHRARMICRAVDLALRHILADHLESVVSRLPHYGLRSRQGFARLVQSACQDCTNSLFRVRRRRAAGAAPCTNPLRPGLQRFCHCGSDRRSVAYRGRWLDYLRRSRNLGFFRAKFKVGTNSRVTLLTERPRGTVTLTLFAGRARRHATLTKSERGGDLFLTMRSGRPGCVARARVPHADPRCMITTLTMRVKEQ